MKALPFPCIRPAQDRVLEALPAMGGILSGNDALRGAIAEKTRKATVLCFIKYSTFGYEGPSPAEKLFPQ